MARAWERSGVRGFVLALLLSLILGLGLMPAAGVSPAMADQACAVPSSQCGCAACGCATPPSPRCPEGFQPYDDYCLPACPDGWLRYPGYPGLCTPPCEHGCPEGYEQVPLPKCPDGYHRDLQNPDDCVADFAHTQDDCPAGMVLSANTLQCVPDCPDGTYRDARGLCRSYYQDPCPAGFGRDPETGQCVPPGDWQPGYAWICLPSCPPGTERDFFHPTRCVPAEPQCPQGFESWHGRCLPPCEQGARRDAYGYCLPPQCPPGTYANLRGQCVPPPCPPGFDNLQGRCVPPCDAGLSRDANGRCVPPDNGCPPGSETFRGQCVPPCMQGYTRDMQSGTCLPPPDTGCGPGMEKLRGQCVPICATGQVRDGNGRCITPGCPSGTETFHGTCLPLCRKDLVRQPDGSCGCPQGEDSVNGQCMPACPQGRQRDANGRCVQPSCPDGQEKVRGRCVAACSDGMVHDPRGRCVCPQGTSMSARGLCERVTGNQPCGPGTHPDASGTCISDGRMPTQCPDGWHFSRKRLRCVQDNQDQPNGPPVRQPGLLVNPNTLQMLQPKLRQNGLDMQQSCPKGYVPDGNGGCTRG